MRPLRATPRRAAIAGLVLALIAATGCQSDPDVAFETPDDLDSPPVTALTASPAAVWGSGRAVLARTAPDGTVVVATTTGVYLATGDAEPPVRLHEFETSADPGMLAVSPDGSTLILTTALPARMMWFDLTTRTQTHQQDLEAGDVVTSLWFHPDGSGLVAAGRNGLSAWPDGPLSGPIALTDRGTPLGATAMLADGRLIAPFTNSATFAVIDGITVTYDAFEDLGDDKLLDAKASPSGEVLAMAVGDAVNRLDAQDRIRVSGDLTTFDLRSEIEFDRPIRPDDWTMTDEHIVVTDRTAVEVWTFDGDLVTTLDTAATGRVDRLVATGSGFATIEVSGTTTAWDPVTWEPIGTRTNENTIIDVGVDHDGTTLTSVEFHGLVQRWDVTAASSVAEIRTFASGRLNGVDVDATGARVGAVSGSGVVALLGPDLAEQWVFEPSAANVDTIVFNPVADDFVTGLAERLGDLAFDDTTSSWDPATQTERFRLGGESEDVAGCSFFYNRLRFTGDGLTMAATSHDFSISIIDTVSGEVIDEVPPRATSILDIAYTPDDDLLIATSDNSRVLVLETHDYEPLAEYDSPMGGYLAIAPLPDSATMAVLDITGSIGLVDIMTGERLLDFADATTRTSSMAVSLDGTLLAAPAADSTIGIWSTTSGARLATLAGHAATVSDVAFAPDGTWLASSSFDGTVRTWTLDINA